MIGQKKNEREEIDCFEDCNFHVKVTTNTLRPPAIITCTCTHPGYRSQKLFKALARELQKK